MIRKYVFGKMIETEAVVLQIQDEQLSQFPFFSTDEKSFSLKLEMSDKDKVYGLGEAVRGINKRGWLYKSKCSDDPSHTEDKNSLYGAHNFILLDGEVKFGLFIDYPGMITFDVGYSSYRELKITLEDFNCEIYVIEGASKLQIVKEFRRLIGTSYIAPRWAFGYGQSRWSYMNADEVRAIVSFHKENQLPLDSVYLDIDYMERYKDFTINQDAFPDFQEFVHEMKEQNIHLIPIIDAGVKIEDGYDIYEEGIRHDYFCKKENGEPFVAGVWPGRVHFPDMLHKDARKWFGRSYHFLLEKGIDGFWNDMNEPAIFYSEERLQQVFLQIQNYSNQNLDIQSFFSFKNLVETINNNPEDYKAFFHEMNGERIRHDHVHNLYGYMMTRAAGEAFLELQPEKRILLFSRASYIGMHRYGGIWTGDNMSWWSHLKLNIQMMPSLNMCGFLYSGADIGGFGGNVTEDLMLRWLAFGIFTPLLRNHSAMGTRKQELSEFEKLPVFRNLLQIRYGLLPYIYSEYMKSVLNHEMYMLPLSFIYEHDERAAQVEDQLMIGESIMIAPVYEQNARGRYVYLPETMKLIRMKSLLDKQYQVLEQGVHYLECELDEILLFLRPGKILPLSKGGMNMEEVDFNDLSFEVFGDRAYYKLYQDDGISKQYQAKEEWKNIVYENAVIITEK